MAVPRLHPGTIDAVKERADIVDVVSEHVVLKRKGKEYVGLCPFHDDKSPSLTVSPAKQIYHCFSCGAGGGSIKFLMELQNSSFSDVVLDLARRYQVPVDTLDGPQQERLQQQLDRRDSLHRLLAQAADWFQRNLRGAGGQPARRYLKEQRGFSDATIQHFQLGYAPAGWDHLLKHFQRAAGQSPQQLEAAGLVIPRQGGTGHYDRFRQRLMIPIRDQQGRVIGFGGRSLDGSDPKYLNSPESDVFDKGKTLFGLDMAAEAIRKADQAVVVEGYFDVIALHSAGMRNAVAALGTALSTWQIRQLCRGSSSKRIVLNFDADAAGIRAAQRAIGEVEGLALHGQLELRVLQLPAGQDPDDFLKQHTVADYQRQLAAAPLWLDWQIEQLLVGRDLSRNDHFQQAVRAVVELLGKLPQTAVRSRYLQQVAERLAGGQARLALQLEEDLRQQVKGQRWHGRSSRYEQPGDGNVRTVAEGRLLQLYLLCPHHRLAIRLALRQRELEEFGIALHRRLWAGIGAIEEEQLGVGGVDALLLAADGGTSAVTVHPQPLLQLDLPRLLADRLLAEDRDLQARLTALLEPGEIERVDLSQPLHTLQSACAVLERQRSSKRCRHLIDAWCSQRVQTLERCLAVVLEQEQHAGATSSEPAEREKSVEHRIEALFSQLNDDALRLQELYYRERRYITALDHERCNAVSNHQPDAMA